MSATEIARKFVAPEHFGILVKKQHTVLVGPRGSGKTTLLKMLQSEALEAWQAGEAGQYRKRVDYTGVFVPFDRAWKEQLQVLGQQLPAPESELLRRAAFTTHTLMAWLKAVDYRAKAPSERGLTPHRRIALSLDKEADLCTHLAEAWELGQGVPSLNRLRLGLTQRLADIRILESAELSQGVDGRGTRLAQNRWLHMGVLESLLVAVESFEQITGEFGGRWALLFDELELAPAWTREFLSKSMRSVDERFIFKLSLSPLSGDVAPTIDQPAAGHDLDVIRLWYPHKEEADRFCRALFMQLVRRRGIANSPEQLLGRSLFEGEEDAKNPKGTSYRRGAPTMRRFLRLADRDSSFAAYLRENGIDLRTPERVLGARRAETLRKITTIVAVRETFLDVFPRAAGSNVGRLRPRKNPPLYTGASSLFAMTEGNPRLVIGLTERLLRRVINGSVSRAHQAHEVRRVTALYQAFLRTIPSPYVGRGGQRGVLGLIRTIAERFSEGVVLGPFDPEPPGTFVVDARTPHELLDGLEDAVKAGALIYVPDDEGELLLSSPRGKKFRLSYLLAARYRLPLLVMRDVPLSALLGEKVRPLF